MTGRLTGKTILVTGGSTGLGEAMARACAAEGAVVALTARGVEAGEAVAADIRARGGQAAFFRHDASSPDSWAEMMAEVDARLGALHGLINNAGRGYIKYLSDLSFDEFHELNRLNLHGAFLGMKHGCERMADSGGTIINMGSLASFRAFPGSVAYATSKGAMLGMSRSIRGVARPANVRVHTLFPGRFWTPIIVAAGSPEVRAAQEAAHPMKRFGQPAELGEPVVFLMSDAARDLDGVEIVLDGGQTLG